MIDTTTANGYVISLGSLAIETVTTLSVAIAVVFKLGRAMERFETVGVQQAKEISELKTEVKVVTEILRDVAVQNQRIDTLEFRTNRNDKLLDDMRRGVGWILPVNPQSKG